MTDLRRALRRRDTDVEPSEAEPAGHLELVPEHGRTWRWRYVEPTDDGEPLVLTSHIEYPDTQAARAAARTGYPTVPCHDKELAGASASERTARENEKPAGPVRRPRAGALMAAVLWLSRRRRRR